MQWADLWPLKARVPAQDEFEQQVDSLSGSEEGGEELLLCSSTGGRGGGFDLWPAALPLPSGSAVLKPHLETERERKRRVVNTCFLSRRFKVLTEQKPSPSSSVNNKSPYLSDWTVGKEFISADCLLQSFSAVSCESLNLVVFSKQISSCWQESWFILTNYVSCFRRNKFN